MRKIKKVCVYCASSPQVDQTYFDQTDQLAKILVDADITTVYGGGAVGLMGHLADKVLEYGGHVIGIMPQFMKEVEMEHKKVKEFHFVEDMHARKKKFLDEADALIALPGGCGTLEELLEAITLKRLGLFVNPIIIVNHQDYYTPLLEMLDRCISEKFMSEKHREIWTVVAKAEEVLDAIEKAPDWHTDAYRFATPK